MNGNLYDACVLLGHAVAQWLRHYATNQKVAGLKSNEVIFFKFT
jgi:hypothetical protein